MSRSPLWNCRTNGMGRFTPRYHLRGKDHSLKPGAITFAFPHPSRAFLRAVARHHAVVQAVARNPDPDAQDEAIRRVALETNPALETWPDFGRLVEWIRVSVADLQKQVPGPARLAMRPETIGDLFLAWERRRRELTAGKSEMSAIRTCAKTAAKVFGRRAPIDLDPVRWEAVVAALAEQGKTKQTVQKYLKSVISMMEWAAYQGWIPDSIPNRLRMAPRLRQDAFRETEPVEPVADEIVRQTTAGARSRRLRYMIHLQRIIGCRPGELCRMKWDELIKNSWDVIRYWRVRKHKTAHRGKSRQYVIGPKARKLLDIWAGHQQAGNPYVFVNKHGKPVTLEQYRRAIHRVCKRIGIPAWNPNQLRHSRATEVSHKFGVEAEAASLGHTAAVAQRVYVERNMKLAEEVADKIG